MAHIIFPAMNMGKPLEQSVYGGLNQTSTQLRSVTVKTPTGYAVEAYFPADLGGDAFSGTLVFDPDDKGEIEMPPASVDPAP